MGPYWVLLAVAIAATLTWPVAVLVFAPAPFFSQAAPAARLVVSVTVDKQTYLPREPVIITVQVTNAGNAMAEIQFGSTCLATYTILSMDGSVVYDYRAHATCGQMLTTVPLRPEEARAFAFTWGQTSDSGVPVLPFRSYHVQGAILSAKPSPAPSAETRIFVMQGPSGPNLAFTARTDRTSYGPSDSAKVTVILTNIGLDTIVMHFGQPCFV